MWRCVIRLISLIALCDDRQRVLLLKRPADKHCGGFWSLPGGKQQRNESALDCAQRELREEVGVVAVGWRQCHQWRYRYPDRTLCFTLFQAAYRGDSLCCESLYRWCDMAALQLSQFPPANREIIPLEAWLAPVAQ